MDFSKKFAGVMMAGCMACFLIILIRIGMATLSYECWSRELLKRLKTRHSRIYDELAPFGPFCSGSIWAIYAFAQSDRLQNVDEIQALKGLVVESLTKLIRLLKTSVLLMLVFAFILFISKIAGLD